ncbi:U4/U6.U5 tri-snRNP-associated protein 1 [Schistocerca piceifrons]|uniref:U4/U6.U5 tri-snRNP-associated protein 1 n=1 Tax=Schistocerca piceifrons TaxID=274613 RepID=UPI001F5F9DB8|nr:U4/U6.U5 tri-snRNP-associated protein 1 [Schistocerca piceifrons]
MGSTKKHKHSESKKKKHRSRSRSPERKERHRHHKKHHKEKKKDKLTSKERNGEYAPKHDSYESEDDDVVVVPPPPKISARPSPPPPPSISLSKSKENDAAAAAPTNAATATTTATPATDTQSYQSLSIEETNRLRARLGLKPLAVEPAAPTAEQKEKMKEREESGATLGGTDMGEFVHKPAESITEKVKTEKVRQKVQEHRERRLLESKMLKVKPLGESDDEEYSDVAAWVQKNRKLQQEKEKAEKQAKMLEELDAEFGVGDLVEDEMRNEKREAYTSKDLRGLRVEHAVDRFMEEREVILTLKDKDVLDEEDDVLVNVNLMDEERYEKNVENKKLKPNSRGYNVYEDEGFDEFGNYRRKEILSKYDEEIKGATKQSFAIGEDVTAEKQKQALEAVRNRLQKKRVESLVLPAPQLASEYYTAEEVEVKFKKPKKKVRKIRKKPLKAEELANQVPSTWDFATRSIKREEGSDADECVINPLNQVVVKQEPDEVMDVDDLPPPPEDLNGLKLDQDESELELHLALKKARKLKLKEMSEQSSSVEKVAKTILDEAADDGSEQGGSIVLNATAEFCRTLGDIPTYGLSGNRDEDAEELLDFERELVEEKNKQDEEGKRGAWNEVEIDERPVDVLPAEVPILDAEPDVGVGVAGALRLAVSKGYLEKEDMNKPSASRFAHLQAQNYSIEDKTHIDDDKFGRRERYNGPTSEFKEKDGYKPNVKLDYIDDDGHVLNAKEAFRYLSHKFHGKGPGKNKVEKRMKKNEQEGLMKQMSSTDTPLGTLSLLQQKQKETQSAFVVLSGSKQATSISKTLKKH